MATITAPAVLRVVIDMETFERVTLRPPRDFSDDDFFDFCQEHELCRIERNAQGEIIIMPLLGFEDSIIQSEVMFQLWNWAKLEGRGLALGANAGITLPDTSVVAPGAFWFLKEVWRGIPRPERQKFALLVPPFVIEIRSASDRKEDVCEKMLMYMRNGIQLGWLIDLLTRTVRIYRQGQEFVELNDPAQIEGEGPVAGFVLNLKQICD